MVDSTHTDQIHLDLQIQSNNLYCFKKGLDLLTCFTTGSFRALRTFRTKEIDFAFIAACIRPVVFAFTSTLMFTLTSHLHCIYRGLSMILSHLLILGKLNSPLHNRKSSNSHSLLNG